MKLTAKTVSGLKLPANKTDVIFFDEDLAGFGFRLRASGDRLLRSWVAQYRNADGDTRRKSIGSAETLSAKQARGAAKKTLAEVALGGDPQADKVARRQKDVRRFRDVVGDYLQVKRPLVRMRTYREIVRYLTGPYFKPLHAMPVDQITRKDIASCLTKITAENGSITAGRARAALSAFHSWGVAHGLADLNPVVGTLKPADAKPRERVLDNAELAAIWHTCKDDQYGKIIKLLVLTGARRQEVGGMVWNEVDVDRGAWTIPSNRTKNGRQHILPLPRLALSIIESVERRIDRNHLFGERAVGFTSWAVAKDELDARLAGAVQPWRLHDLRRTAATRMADLGIAPHIIETILNHQSGHRAGVAGIYNRSSYEREVRTALARWADHLESIVTGTERRVVAFERPAV